MTITKNQLSKMYKEFYDINDSCANVLTTGQTNVKNKKSKKTALFTDEFSRAPLDIRQAALQLVLDRKIHQHELPVVDGQRTFIIAADNPDNGNYAVETLDPALLDRFLVFDVEVDVQGWLDYAKQRKLSPIVNGFIAENPKKLHFQPEEGSDDTIGCSPRSWTQLAAFVDNMKNTPREIHYEIISGKIGKALAAQFLNYMNNFQNMISTDDVIKLVSTLDKKGVKIEGIGEAVAELTENLETIQITELVSALMLKYKDTKDVKDAMPLMAILYSLNIEVLSAFFKRVMKDDTDMYLKLTNFDEKLNNKAMFFKVVKHLNFD